MDQQYAGAGSNQNGPDLSDGHHAASVSRQTAILALLRISRGDALQQHQEFQEYYQRLCGKGMRPEMAQLTLARKLAAIVLILWKKGELYDSERLNQAAPGAGQQ